MKKRKKKSWAPASPTREAPENTEKEESQERDQLKVLPIDVRSNDGATEGFGSAFNPDLKTVVLWIYNINQNGSANAFREAISPFFVSDNEGNVTLRDMSAEMLQAFFADLSIAKEVTLPDLGLRLILLIYNCNQNGTSNTAELACGADS